MPPELQHRNPYKICPAFLLIASSIISIALITFFPWNRQYQNLKVILIGQSMFIVFPHGIQSFHQTWKIRQRNLPVCGSLQGIFPPAKSSSHPVHSPQMPSIKAMQTLSLPLPEEPEIPTQWLQRVPVPLFFYIICHQTCKVYAFSDEQKLWCHRFKVKSILSSSKTYSIWYARLSLTDLCNFPDVHQILLKQNPEV